MAKARKNSAKPAAPKSAAPSAEGLEPGFVRLQAPEDCTSFSYGGQEYEIGEDGEVDVDGKTAKALLSHGFTRIA